MASPLDKVAKRFGITVREARDIATAVGTVGSLARSRDVKNRGAQVKKAVKGVVKQVKETGVAAKTGKKGTTAGLKGTKRGEVPYKFVKGTKRK